MGDMDLKGKGGQKPSFYKKRIMALFLNPGDFGKLFKPFFQFFISGNVIAHSAFHIGSIGGHIEITGSRQAEKDGFGFAAFPALDGFVHGRSDRMGGFRGGQDGFLFGKEGGGFKDLG